VSEVPSLIRKHARLAASVLGMACSTLPGNKPLSERIATVLESRDGYVFVFSPFNCSLQARQIDEMNVLASRARRSGVVLATGPSGLSDSAAVAAVDRLGIKLKARALERSGLEYLVHDQSFDMPMVIAIRQGAIIGILSGASAERLDTWIPWLERRQGVALP
jgi:hypothetical protein